MSRRDAILRAVAGGLQPPAIDLTQFRRQGTRDERRIKVRGDTVAGALAFAALDQFEGQDGKPAPANDDAAQRLPGDPLAPLLTRLKYAGQFTKDPFEQAQLLLLRRYDSLGPTKQPKILFAVAGTALFEWVHDRCPKCRRGGARPKQPRPCHCAPRTESVSLSTADGRTITRSMIVTSPLAGCPTCKGLGRIFDKPKERLTGMRCVACRNTGRVEFRLKQRWELVNDYAREIGASIALDAFRSHWSVRYHHFIDVLRATDRRIVADLALGLERSYKRSTIADPRATGADPETHEPECEAVRPQDEALEGIARLENS